MRKSWPKVDLWAQAFDLHPARHAKYPFIGKQRQTNRNDHQDPFDLFGRGRIARPFRHMKQPTVVHGSGFIGKPHLSDIGQVSVSLCKINAIAHNERIGDCEPGPIGTNVDLAP